MSSSSRRLAGSRRVGAASSFSPDAASQKLMMPTASAYNYHYYNHSYQRRSASRRTTAAGCYRAPASARGSQAAAPSVVRCFRCLRAGVARVLRFLFTRRRKAGAGGGTSSAGGRSNSSGSSVSSYSSSSSVSSSSRVRAFSSAAAPLTSAAALRAPSTRPPPSPYCAYVLDDTYRHQSQDIQDCIDFIKYSSYTFVATAAPYGGGN